MQCHWKLKEEEESWDWGVQLAHGVNQCIAAWSGERHGGSLAEPRPAMGFWVTPRPKTARKITAQIPGTRTLSGPMEPRRVTELPVEGSRRAPS